MVTFKKMMLWTLLVAVAAFACFYLWVPTAHAQAGAACKVGGTVAETNDCAVQDF